MPGSDNTTTLSTCTRNAHESDPWDLIPIVLLEIEERMVDLVRGQDILLQQVSALRQEQDIILQEVGIIRQEVGIIRQDVGIMLQEQDIMIQEQQIFLQQQTPILQQCDANNQAMNRLEAADDRSGHTTDAIEESVGNLEVDIFSR